MVEVGGLPMLCVHTPTLCFSPTCPVPCALPTPSLTWFFFSEGTKKLTNKATLWYVPLSLKNVDKVLEVPPVVVRRPLLLSGGRWQRLHGRRRTAAVGTGGRVCRPDTSVEWGVPVWDLRAGFIHVGNVLVDTPPGGPFLMSLTRGKAGGRDGVG